MKLITTLSRLFKKEGAIDGNDSQVTAQDKPILSLLGENLREHGVDLRELEGRLRLASGIELRVEHIRTVEHDNGSVQTSTQIIASHPLLFPQGLHEYQHSLGASVGKSLSSGFANWIKMDLVTLQDSLRDTPEDCTFMDMTFPAAVGETPRIRRVIFGPTGHMVSPAKRAAKEEHPFCPCCMITQNVEVFRSVMQSEQTLGIRLFASKDDDGKISADCRINGEDFAAGAEQLKDYVRTWPQRQGLEFRKQYVVIRSIERSDNAISMASQ